MTCRAHTFTTVLHVVAPHNPYYLPILLLTSIYPPSPPISPLPYAVSYGHSQKEFERGWAVCTSRVEGLSEGLGVGRPGIQDHENRLAFHEFEVEGRRVVVVRQTSLDRRPRRMR